MIRLCINTQTPPLRLEELGGQRTPERISLETHAKSVGGVVPMMFSLLRTSAGKWVAPNPVWVSSGREGMAHEIVTEEGFRLDFVEVPSRVLPGYLRFKREMWDAFHGISHFSFDNQDYLAFVEYSHLCATKLLKFIDEVDAYYVNDFQQIQIGSLIGPVAPALLRWHIPFQLGGIPRPLRNFFLKSVEGFDAVVLSTRREMEDLIRSGYRGRAYQIYPYIDVATVPQTTPNRSQEFRSRWKLGEGPVILMVARMDAQKRHDLALRAFARIRRRFPSAVLVLVGNGSFTASQEARVQTKAGSANWKDQLQKLCRALRIEGSVRFAGYLNEEDIHAAYETCDVLVLPSIREGFGLVGIEAWLHRKPIVVSSGAGISELVIDGVNGYIAQSGSVEELSGALAQVLRQPSLSEKMGEFGFNSAKQCHVDYASKRLRRIFTEVVEEYAPHKHPSR
ncbi:MAG: glycosyltransferase family 4 protein [Candidatus Thermoplasmatota archaeon]|jgi:glycosyltransferase involved in cell wall biosynthesis|nr:glycosyltransferase family 4 protein [Candidatus Thermoplasmatota archaeon]